MSRSDLTDTTRWIRLSPFISWRRVWRADRCCQGREP